MRKLLALGMVLAVSVMVAGVLLDDYFGARPVVEYEHELALEAAAEKAGTAHATETTHAAETAAPAADATEGLEAPATAGSAPKHQPADPGILKDLALFRQQKDAMLLPMLLGVIQVVFGWALRIRNQTRHHGWQGFGQPTGNILIMAGVVFYLLPAILIPMLFHYDSAQLTIGPLPVGQWMTALPLAVGQGLLIGGIALVLLFNGLENHTKIFLRPLTGLWSLYELVQGLIGDILSYIRLFALGLAGGLLAESFNNIAMGIVKDAQGPLPFLFMTAILLLGHTINLGIGLLSAFVHSLRLQFVEFYKAIEFKGGGVEYDPLRNTKPQASAQSLKKQA
jgi:vacuolar-type H+-ATPase subunit I/STV1